MNVVLDAGALIAVDRRDRRVGAMLRLLQQQGTPVRTSAAVVAQVWRDGARQANLARALAGTEIRSLDTAAGKGIGELLRKDRSNDVVDAHVALLTEPGAKVLTSDPDEIRSLLKAKRTKADVVPV